MEPPITRFVHCGDGQIAYQLFGTGPVEVVVAGGPAGHVELYWELAEAREWYERLGTFARVAIFDRRGTGASDPGSEPPCDQQWLEDVEAVIKASRFDRPALIGAVEAARLCALYAAVHPEQISSLVLTDMAARGSDILGADHVDWLIEIIEQRWGTGEMTALYAPTMVDNDRYRRWIARMERLTVPPRSARQILGHSVESDVSDMLSRISCPTLVIHHRENSLVPVELGRAAAGAIPNARFVEIDGRDSFVWLGDKDAMLGEIEEFLTGRRSLREPSRRLRAILFTDIVGSTELAARLSDHRWRQLLAEHDRLVRRAIESASGTVVKSIGDGFLAVFDTAEQAIVAAQESLRATRALSIKLRAGIHVGAVDHIDGDIRGIAVHIAARISERASEDQILISATVKDILIDRGIPLEAVGAVELRGVPETWLLYGICGESAEANEGGALSAALGWPAHMSRD